MKLRLLIGFIFILSNAGNLEAQPTKLQKELGEQLFADEQYAKAYQILKKYYQNHASDNETLLKVAICAFHIDEIEEANRYFNLIARKENFYHEKLALYRARVACSMNNFEQAVSLYKVYLRSTKASSLNRYTIKQELLQCANGLRLDYQIEPSIATISLINTKANESRMLPSPTQPELYYFNSDRKGNEDIYMVKEGKVELLEGIVNTTQDEYLAGFSSTGNQLFFFRGDTLKFVALEKVSLDIKPPTFEIETPYWYSDSILLFSSQQLDGLGGSDIFYTRWKNGNWSAPINLGNVINSKYDEQYPVLAKDGRTLFFSSNHLHRSIGLSDIYVSYFDYEKELWYPPVNLGTRINSYAGEHPNALKDSMLIYTSNQWQGKGKTDIFQAAIDSLIEFQVPTIFFDDIEIYKLHQANELADQELIYRVLIATETTQIDDKIPTHFPEPFVSKKNDRVHYYVGKYRSFRSALELQKELARAGWKATVITPFLDEIQLDEITAKTIIDTFPDLKAWLGASK